MEIFFDNFFWIIPNVALASLGFIFGLLYFHSKQIFLKIPLFILWLLFMPNTIYLLTDIQYFSRQVAQTDIVGAGLLVIQYAILMLLGILTYFAAMKPIETFFKKQKKTNNSYVFIIANFAAAFAVVLGKIERTHSWYVFTQPERVIGDVLNVLLTPQLFMAVILFGVFINLIYFGLKNKIPSLK